MTQSSIAVSGDGVSWSVLNASPDLRGQLERTPDLHPLGARKSPLHSVLLTNGDIDHVAGLLSLREKQAFRLFATAEIHAALDANPVFNVLDSALVARVPVALETPFALAPGIRAKLFAAPGKVPLYLEGNDVRTDLEGEQTVGVQIDAGAARAFYVPGCARMTPALAMRLDGAVMVFFDGTLYEDDEMIAMGLGAKTGARMGHMPMNGSNGSMAAFAGLGVANKVYIHMNNSNPVLDPRRPERGVVEAAGWTVAGDGMEFEL